MSGLLGTRLAIWCNDSIWPVRDSLTLTKGRIGEVMYHRSDISLRVGFYGCRAEVLQQ